MDQKVKEILDKTIIDEILLIILGLALLIWPNAALNLVFRAVGVVILVMGILRITAYVKNKQEILTKELIIGIGMVVAGLILIIAPSILTSVGPMCAAILIGYGAIVSLVKGIQTMRAGYTGGVAAVVISGIALVLAVIILFHPVAFAGFLARLIGIALIIAGIGMIVAAYQKSKV